VRLALAVIRDFGCVLLASAPIRPSRICGDSLHAGYVLVLDRVTFGFGHFVAHVVFCVVSDTEGEDVLVSRFDGSTLPVLRGIWVRGLCLSFNAADKTRQRSTETTVGF
jgi:hypothetical protein